MVVRHRSRLAAAASLSLIFAVSPAASAGADSRAVAHRLPRVAPYIGTAPTSCPAVNLALVHMRRNNQPHSAPPIITWVQGGALAGYSGWFLVSHRLALGFGARTKYGYPQKIFWQLVNGSRGPVTLQGRNLRTGRPIWFGRPLPNMHPRPLMPGPVIAWPSAIIRPHRGPTLTFFPSAGCYVIQARWPGGGWSIPFTAGG